MDRPPIDGPAPRRGEVAAVALIATVLAAAVAAWWFTSAVDSPAPAGRYVAGRQVAAVYDPPVDAVERALNKGDGQVFAAQATDPLARTPDLIRGGPTEQAYRYQRPAYGWLGWLASGGGARHRVAPALAAVTVAATGLLVLAGARYLAARGTDPRGALLLLLLPGVAVDLTWIGPEVLGLGLVVLGLDAWLRRPPGPPAVPWRAVGAFAAAGLCRETLLVVPATLAALALVRRRPAEVAGLAAAALPYLAWVVHLRLALGAWPSGSVDGRLSPVPYGGLVAAVDTWTAVDLVLAVALVGVAVAALVRTRGTDLGWLVAVHLVLAGTLGEPVWHRVPDFGRVLLPLGALSVLALLTGRVSPVRAASRTAPAPPRPAATTAPGAAPGSPA